MKSYIWILEVVSDVGLTVVTSEVARTSSFCKRDSPFLKTLISRQRNKLKSHQRLIVSRMEKRKQLEFKAN